MTAEHPGNLDHLGRSSAGKDSRFLESVLDLRDVSLLQLAPAEAIRRQIETLNAAAELDSLSVWSVVPGQRVRCVGSSGEHAVTRRTRDRAREIAQLGEDAAPNRPIQGVAVTRGGLCVGAIVFRAPSDRRELAVALAREAAPLIACAFERAALLETSEERLQLVLQASERRLSRLTFDMHDGPAQDILALLSEVRLFRRQLSDSLVERAARPIVLGRLDDLEARLVALDSDLREVIQSFQTPGLFDRPFADVLADEAENLKSRDGIDCALEIRGEMSDGVTASQRIAIMRVIQESLSNVRVHSGAQSVRVVLAAIPGGVQVEIADDGVGFDVERTLVRSARLGRLGLLGMAERIRLLGGTFDVRSQPGGPTSIHAYLPEWRPPPPDPITGETPLQPPRRR